MKDYYKKYYDALKGNDFTSKVSGYTSSLSNVNNKLTAIESTINSSLWIEKGLEIIRNSVIPSLKAQRIQIERGFESLNQVTRKVSELVDQLKELDELEHKLESLGGRWNYVDGGKYSKQDVDYHNSEISSFESKIATQESLINSTIIAINSISFVYNDTRSIFSESAKKLETVIKENSSGVLSATPGTFYPKGREVNVLGRSATLLDVVCDGKSLGQDGTIVIKKGTTVHLKVKVPDEIKNVSSIRRTSADGTRGPNGEIIWKNWVDQECNPNVNRYDSSTWVNQREYDWYITGKEETDDKGITVSQTSFFTIPGGYLDTYKGMTRVNVKVVA